MTTTEALRLWGPWTWSGSLPHIKCESMRSTVISVREYLAENSDNYIIKLAVPCSTTLVKKRIFFPPKNAGAVNDCVPILWVDDSVFLVLTIVKRSNRVCLIPVMGRLPQSYSYS